MASGLDDRSSRAMQRAPGIEDIIDEKDGVFPNVDVERAAKADPSGGLTSRAIAGQPQKADRWSQSKPMQGASQIGQKHITAIHHADQDPSRVRGHAFFDGTGQERDTGLNLAGGEENVRFRETGRGHGADGIESFWTLMG